MSNSYFEEQVYEGMDYTAKGFGKGQYEACSFVNCNFSNTDLSEISFTECNFKGCNLSMVKLLQTTLNDAKFSNCKMLGINYEHCNMFLFTVTFENCILNFSSFYKRVLKKKLHSKAVACRKWILSKAISRVLYLTTAI